MTIDKSSLYALWQEAFGDGQDFWDSFTATALDKRRCLTATVDGHLAGMLYWFDCTCRGKPVAYVYGVATAKAFRGQGICHGLMDRLHAHLQEKGYAGTLLVPGEESLFRFYEAMGYQSFGGMTTLSCFAGSKACQIREVDTAEFSRLRRKLLPEGGVVQEGENLAFLSAQAKLYAGPDFVLAAKKEGQHLFALELLGDQTAAPGILTALGCGEGKFRLFGNSAPFAMYRPLSDDAPPSYFAFAFD